jgi:hypothetical protein
MIEQCFLWGSTSRRYKIKTDVLYETNMGKDENSVSAKTVKWLDKCVGIIPRRIN